MIKEIGFVLNNFLTLLISFSLFCFDMNIKFYIKSYKNKIYNAIYIWKSIFNKTKFELKFKDNIWH